MTTAEVKSSPEDRGWLAVQLSRFAGVVLAPQRTLPRLATEPGIWVPVVVLTVALAGLRLTMVEEQQRTYRDPEFKQWYAEQRDVSQAKAERDVDMLIKAAPLMSILEAPLITVLGIGAVALVIWLAGRISYRARLPFRWMFGLVAWASLVGAIPFLLNIPLKIISPDWTLPTNPAALMPASLAGSYFHRIMTSLDIFLVWQVWLLSLGTAGLFKVTVQRALGTIGTIFICFIVLNALFTGSGP